MPRMIWTRKRQLRRWRGLRQITKGLGALDREVFEAIADSPTPLLDAEMQPLSRAADQSKPWFLIAAALLRPENRPRGGVRLVAWRAWP